MFLYQLNKLLNVGLSANRRTPSGIEQRILIVLKPIKIFAIKFGTDEIV